MAVMMDKRQIRKIVIEETKEDMRDMGKVIVRLLAVCGVVFLALAYFGDNPLW